MEIEETSSDNIMRELSRGVEDILPIEELKTALKKGKILRVKAGFDPTAADLH